MPVTRSEHGRTLTRSPRLGWICHVQPLSTMKPMLVRPGARRREWVVAFRRRREAKNTLAGVAGGGEGAFGCGPSSARSELMASISASCGARGHPLATAIGTAAAGCVGVSLPSVHLLIHGPGM
eukprot:1817318-Pleurochrysis_carterae.AAC.1